MKDSNTTIPPQVQYEKEIREIYHERNAKRFTVPNQPLKNRPRFYGELLAALVVAVVVSVVVSVATVSLIEPLTSWTIIQSGKTAAVSPAPDINEDTVKNLFKSVVYIYPAQPSKADNLIDRAYIVSEGLGQGLVLSSDGWIVTTPAVVSNPKQVYQVIAADGVARPTEIILLDPVLPLVYLKIKAGNLTPTALVDESRLTLGQSTIVLAYASQSLTPQIFWRRLSNLNSISVVQRGDLLLSSESVPDRILLDQNLPKLAQGAIVANAKGEVIGLAANFAGSLNGIIPFGHLTGVIDSLFSSQQVKRPALGINYVQSVWLKGLNNNSADAAGAQIAGYDKKPAVLAKSAAARAGLQNNDQIISLNGERVGVSSLSAMLQQYRPGDQVELLIKRAVVGELKISVKLGELTSGSGLSAGTIKK
ncbi:MAG: S1C family serine protease [Patescibacteria group bacterium]